MKTLVWLISATLCWADLSIGYCNPISNYTEVPVTYLFQADCNWDWDPQGGGTWFIDPWTFEITEHNTPYSTAAVFVGGVDSMNSCGETFRCSTADPNSQCGPNSTIDWHTTFNADQHPDAYFCPGKCTYIITVTPLAGSVNYTLDVGTGPNGDHPCTGAYYEKFSPPIIALMVIASLAGLLVCVLIPAGELFRRCKEWRENRNNQNYHQLGNAYEHE